jgi:hypothetical protein
MTKNPIARKTNLVLQEIKNETLVYDLDKNKAFCLNETSSLVWQLINGNMSVSEISQSISIKLNQPVTDSLVLLALEQLKEEDLLEGSEEIIPAFPGLTRREVIRKVGLGSMVALPFIVGLVAPTSAQAQSCGPDTGPNLPLGCHCQTNASCASNNCDAPGGGGGLFKTCQP